MGKIQFSASDLDITKLNEDDKDDLSSFSCGKDDCYNELNAFFQSQELYLSNKYHYYSVYVVRLKKTSELIAVFTLANDCIVLKSEEDEEDLKEELRPEVADEYCKILEKQTSYPAINIGHLGVKEEYQSCRIGGTLVNFIIGSFINFDQAGCQFITVDSLNNSRTNKFYSSHNFSNLSNSDFSCVTQRKYLLLECVKKVQNDNETV